MIVGHKDDIAFVRPDDPSIKGAEMKKIIRSE